ncbi:response regulator [Candidatus Gottesmanbacteria bacterium]|nr:response regulator [Candidatus Gottesmanbacteria bacterium]
MPYIGDIEEKLQKRLYNIESFAVKGGSLIHQFQDFLDYAINQNEDNSKYFNQLIDDLQILYSSFNIDSDHKKTQNISTMVGQTSILIVDDEKEMRHALSYALTLCGHHVMTAADGKKAIDILKNKSYDVAFVDFKMPGMNGLELSDAIKKIDADIKVILMTGWNVQLNQEKFGSNIIDAMLSKPFNLSEVFDLITKFIT